MKKIVIEQTEVKNQALNKKKQVVHLQENTLSKTQAVRSALRIVATKESRRVEWMGTSDNGTDVVLYVVRALKNWSMYLKKSKWL